MYVYYHYQYTHKWNNVKQTLMLMSSAVAPCRCALFQLIRQQLCIASCIARYIGTLYIFQMTEEFRD